MADRITRGILDTQFRIFCDTYQLPIPERGKYPTHGQYHLEQPIRGHYRVAKVSDTGTGESNPFGNSLQTARGMYDQLYFAVSVAERSHPQPPAPTPAPVVEMTLSGGLLWVQSKPAGVALVITDYDCDDAETYRDIARTYTIHSDDQGEYITHEYPAVDVIPSAPVGE